MTDGQGTAGYVYDSMSRLITEERTFAGLSGTFKLSYIHSRSGGVTKVTASGPAPFGNSVVVNYARDQMGRPTAMTGSGYASVSSYVTGITYRAFGAPKQINYSTGNSLTLGYDQDLRLTTWDVSGAPDFGFGWRYEYSTPLIPEKTGRVAFAGNLYDPTLDRSYSYDDVGRLAGAHSGNEAQGHAGYTAWPPGMTPTGPYAENFAYDQYGNLTWRNGWGAPNAQYAYSPQFNARNRMTRNPVTGAPMTYDAAGNLTSDGATDYTYDAQGQQVRAGSTLEQAYDGDGLRVKKTENNVTTYYLRSSVLGNQVVAEVGGSGTDTGKMTRGYVYLGGQLLAVQEGREDAAGRVLWVHQDPLTKSQRLTDRNGAMVSTIDLDPWGGETARSEFQSFQPRRYTTYERDSNGGDEAMFRRYESEISRFAQPDPYEGSYNLADPQSFNRYSYVQNDPVNHTDPTGLMCYNVYRTDYWSDGVVGGPFHVGSYCDNWSGYDRSGEPKGQGGEPKEKKKEPYVDTAVLDYCTQKLFGVELRSFTPASTNRSGTFVGYGPDYIRNHGNNSVFGVLGNAQAFTVQDLTDRRNRILREQGRAPLRDVMEFGYADREYPFVNYIGSDLHPMGALTVQIHELGNSLQNITETAHNANRWVRPLRDPSDLPDNDAGILLENCVEERGGFKER